MPHAIQPNIPASDMVLLQTIDEVANENYPITQDATRHLSAVRKRAGVAQLAHLKRGGNSRDFTDIARIDCKEI